MARRTGKRFEQMIAVVACGSVDQNNPIDALVPSPNAYLQQVAATIKTAGTGAGSFGIQVTFGGTPTTIGPASATSFITAAAAAGTFQGILTVNGQVKDQEGQRLGIKTVKSGTVSADATLILNLTWVV